MEKDEVNDSRSSEEVDNKEDFVDDIEDESTDKPLAVIYKWPAALDTCTEAMEQALKKKYEIIICGPNEKYSIKEALELSPVVYLQPGGGDEMKTAWDDVGKFAKDIREYVSKGGNYVGICMGAFLAGVFDLSGNNSGGFNLLTESGSYSDSYIETEGAEIKTEKEAALDITWNGKVHKIFFQNGPYFSEPTNSNTKIIAKYKNGEIAALITNYKSGKIGVIGPHPEASDDWVCQWKIKPVTNLFEKFVEDTISRS